MYGGQPYQSPPPLPSPASLCGVLLEPGERVVYFRHTKGIGLRVLMFFLGIGLVPILIGLLFLWVAFTDQTETTAITTRRFIRVSGKKPAEVLGLREVAKVETVNGLRNLLIELRLRDAGGRALGVRLEGDDVLRDLVLAIAADPSAAERAASVDYLP
jgi:hypothetical protein